MIRNFEQYKIQENTNDSHSFEQMMAGPSKLFFDDVRDQVLGFADKILAESTAQSIIYPSSYFIVFEYKNYKFQMQFSSRGMSAYCFYVAKSKNSYTCVSTTYANNDNIGCINIGSLSQSIGIMFNKLDKYIKKLS